MNRIVTRFAPSPTGYLQAGNCRTAVFAYLFAKHAQGSFILRIEDTDKARSQLQYEQHIIDTLAWLSLTPDAQYRQSDHHVRHRELLEKLIADHAAYESKEDSVREGARESVIRFRNPGGKVTFTDVIRGEITMPVDDLGDFVIARSLDEPVFHFAVVVDDADEEVTHIIRGEDHISNTPRQILIQRALGITAPTYAHLPLLLGSDRSKLSKRHGAKPVTEYRSMGILPEAMLNYLALLGWHPMDDQEYLTRDELIASFDLSRVQKGGAVFDEAKLLSVNQHWMRTLSEEEYITRGNLVAPDAARLKQAVPLLKERARTFEESRRLIDDELACLFHIPNIDRSLLILKEPKGNSAFTKSALEMLREPIGQLSLGVSPEEVKKALMPFADAAEAKEKGGRGAVLWPLRYALSGAERSPDPFTLIALIGPDESLLRLQNAIAILNQ